MNLMTNWSGLWSSAKSSPSLRPTPWSTSSTQIPTALFSLTGRIFKCQFLDLLIVQLFHCGGLLVFYKSLFGKKRDFWFYVSEFPDMPFQSRSWVFKSRGVNSLNSNRLSIYLSVLFSEPSNSGAPLSIVLHFIPEFYDWSHKNDKFPPISSSLSCFTSNLV